MADRLEEFLDSLGCELWPGEAFYLTDPAERVKAARWFREFDNKFNEFCGPHREPGC